MISPGVIFICLKFCFFGPVRGLKGKKIAQNEKQQLNPSHAISQEQYKIESWFLVH